MALNFTISYTFSPSTTISSSQVNANTSDVANVFTGLEAETKTLSKLKMDADPTIALEVATKQYVDHYAAYRKPVLQYSSGTVVVVETGINGVAGQLQILFPDGTLRTDATAGRIQCNLAQVYSLTGTAQSGINTGSVASNTWYCFFAVKSQVNSTDIVIVAWSLNFNQGNFSTINATFGANSWVYLGTLPYGDNSGSGSAIPSFKMAGNIVTFAAAATGQGGNNGIGLRMATTASATTLSWSYASGMALSSAQVPVTILTGFMMVDGTIDGGGARNVYFGNATALQRATLPASSIFVFNSWTILTGGMSVIAPSAIPMDIFLSAYADGALGVGSNPLF